jgi:hypothetical protein
MSVNDYAMDLEDAAMSAALRAKAVRFCPAHNDVWIRVGDPEAERRAYAIATNMIKTGDPVSDREDLMAAVKDALDQAADGECPACASIRDA